MPHTMTPFFYRHRDLVERVHATTLVGKGAAAWESRIEHARQGSAQ